MLCKLSEKQIFANFDNLLSRIGRLLHHMQTTAKWIDAALVCARFYAKLEKTSPKVASLIFCVYISENGINKPALFEFSGLEKILQRRWGLDNKE